MDRVACRRGARRRVQGGSVSPLVILIVVAILVWWQWDRISAFFRPGTSSGDGKVSVEVLDYRCEVQPSGQVRIDGYVRNTSAMPVGFKAVTAIYDSSDKRSDYLDATVLPSPLPAGQEGTFRVNGSPLPDGGSCKLDSIVDTATDRPVKATRKRR